MINCLVRSEYLGNRQFLSKTYDQNKEKCFYDWVFFEIDNPNIYFTEEEAIELAKLFSSQNIRKNVQVINPLADNKHYLIDYKGKEIKYFLKENPY